MASHLDIDRLGTTPANKHIHVNRAGQSVVRSTASGLSVLRIDSAHVLPGVVRYPERLSREQFYGVAYPLMVLSRRLEDRLLELYRKGYVKGTVTSSAGNEAAAVGTAMPLRPGRDVAALLHRDFASHLLLGATPYQLVCQYLANADSPTHAREGNVHHGDPAARRFPMISHLGKMLSLVVGGTWAARRNGEDVFGLAVIGDGGTSTGEFHESLNLASVHNVPVLFLIQNNHYSFSTPTSAQYRCEHLSDRAQGYGISGRTIDGLDPWTVYSAVCDALEAMHVDPAPTILECMTLRLHGHAAYDRGEYIGKEQREQWWQRDPVPDTRRKVREFCGLSEREVEAMEEAVDEEIHETIAEALKVARPDARSHGWNVYANSSPAVVEPLKVPKAKNGEAVNCALDYILANNPDAFFAGLDIGTYGSAFKTCKGLIDRHGAERVIDMPICESGIIGFALGASQTGARPIVEFQFADFSTEAVTQLGLNAGTWYFRTGQAAPLLLRLPCGGGLTMGAFHSGEYEGLWSRFSGLKLLYPVTAQETFEALVAGFYDSNPCLVFEHKQLYWSKSGPIDFDGNLDAVWRPRRYTEGTDVTVVAFGAMVHDAIAAAQTSRHSVEVWNPFVLQPLELDPIIASVEKTGRLLVVQECGETQGLGDRVISLTVRRRGSALKCLPKLLAAPDVPVPFAPELESYYRPDTEKILRDIEAMMQGS
ncbi:MAG TPA: thiamine pyrophosphate-dependent enzyme [Thermoguttaceae bacterium]|nr:thiamine pyrophosphate-dependent enzyme [Thermoguttaceae bacterium]